MTESIVKTLVDESPLGAIYSVKMTNNTGDYLELTNLGAKITSIHVHKPGGGMANLINPDFPSPLLGGDLGKAAEELCWDITQEGNTRIILSSEISDNLKLGIALTWVNMNRLIIDYYATPKDDKSLELVTSLFLTSKDYSLSSFCPTADGLPVSETEYKDMAFCPLTKDSAEFSYDHDMIKPILEIKAAKEPLRVSLYSTMTRAKVGIAGDATSLVTYNPAPESLAQGETLTEQVIYGIDYITANLASDENDPESPFLGFFTPQMNYGMMPDFDTKNSDDVSVE